MAFLESIFSVFGSGGEEPPKDGKPAKKDGNPLLAMFGGGTGDGKQEEGPGGFIGFIIRLLVAMFSESSKVDKDAPDFEDTAPEKRAEARREYETSRREQEQKGPRYADSAKQISGIVKNTEIANRLNEMRAEAENANPSESKKIVAIMPVDDDGRITESFGHREMRGNKSSTDHKGIDIAGRKPGDTPDIVSTMPGIVVGAGWKEGYGNMVDVVDIYGTVHRYAHLSETTVSAGHELKQGEKIGKMGKTGWATGVHLHYEQRELKGNETVAKDPVLLGHHWKDGQSFTKLQSDEVKLAQSGGDRSVESQVAAAGLKPMEVAGSDAFVPPTAINPKAVTAGRPKS